MGTRPYCPSLLLAMLFGVFSLLVGCADPAEVPDSDLATPHGALLSRHLPGGERSGREAPTLVVARMSKVPEYVFGEDMRWPPGMKPPGAVRTDRVAEAGVGLQGALENLLPETWDAFVAANAEPHDLSKVIRFSGPIVFLTEAALDDLFSEGTDEGWARLFKELPATDALMSMSMPGYSKDGEQALLYRERGSGGLSGSGVYYLLVKDEEIWKIVDKLLVWIA